MVYNGKPYYTPIFGNTHIVLYCMSLSHFLFDLETFPPWGTWGFSHRLDIGFLLTCPQWDFRSWNQFGRESVDGTMIVYQEVCVPKSNFHQDVFFEYHVTMYLVYYMLQNSMIYCIVWSYYVMLFYAVWIFLMLYSMLPLTAITSRMKFSHVLTSMCWNLASCKGTWKVQQWNVHCTGT